MGSSMSRRVPVIHRTGLYTVTLESAWHHTFIHCDIHTKWTRLVKRKLQQDFSNLIELSDVQEFYTLSATDDHKHHKFLALFGFTLEDEVPCDEGRIRHLYQLKKSE